MRSDSLREKPKQTSRVVAAVLAVLWAAVIFYLSAQPRDRFPEHPSFLNVVAHLCEYALLAALLTVAFNSPKRKLWFAGLIAIIIASLYGAGDEFHQYFVPLRIADPFDWLVDTVGALLGAAITVWLIASRTVKRSRERDRLL